MQIRPPQPSCLYPTEEEIALLLVGPGRAQRWPGIAAFLEINARRLGAVEGSRFPPIDPLFRARYWPAVRGFLDRRHGATDSDVITDVAAPDHLYLTEEEVARRLLPPRRRKLWGEAVAALEPKGLPTIDPLFKFRYWPAVRAFLDWHNGLPSRFVPPAADDSGLECWADEPRLGDRQQHVLDHIHEVVRAERPRQGGGRAPLYHLHGRSCIIQIRVLLNRGLIRENADGEGPLFVRVQEA